MFWTNNYVSSPHIEALLNKEASDSPRRSPSVFLDVRLRGPLPCPLSPPPLPSLRSRPLYLNVDSLLAGCHTARIDGRGGYFAGVQEPEQKAGRLVSGGITVLFASGIFDMALVVWTFIAICN